MRKVLLIFCLFFLFAIPVHALENKSFYFGASYGRYYSGRFITNSVADSGNLIKINYDYSLNPTHFIGLELLYCLDDKMLTTTTTPTYAESVTIINIKNTFHLNKIGRFLPYFSIGTAFYGATGYTKTGDIFYISSSVLIADFNAGIGAAFPINDNSSINAQLSFQAIGHSYYHKTSLPYFISLGYQCSY